MPSLIMNCSLLSEPRACHSVTAAEHAFLSYHETTCFEISVILCELCHLEALLMELKTVGKFSSCISDVDFELLNTEFIVDLCFGFGKPNTCVGFAGLDLNSFGTTLTSL